MQSRHQRKLPRFDPVREESEIPGQACSTRETWQTMNPETAVVFNRKERKDHKERYHHRLRPVAGDF